jgi:hypothetical protein
MKVEVQTIIDEFHPFNEKWRMLMNELPPI